MPSGPSVTSVVLASIFYSSYSLYADDFANATILAMSLFQIFFLGWFSRNLNYVDNHFVIVTGYNLVGRLARFLMQIASNAIIMFVMLRGVIATNAPIVENVLAALSLGFFAAAVSQGYQYIGLFLANRNIGNKNQNVLVSLGVTIVTAALAAMNLDELQAIILQIGIIISFPFILVWVFEDIAKFKK